MIEQLWFDDISFGRAEPGPVRHQPGRVAAGLMVPYELR